MKWTTVLNLDRLYHKTEELSEYSRTSFQRSPIFLKKFGRQKLSILIGVGGCYLIKWPQNLAGRQNNVF